MSLSELQTIPGVGKTIAQYLLNIGIGLFQILKVRTQKSYTLNLIDIQELYRIDVCFMYLDVRSIMPNTSSMILRS